MKESSKHVFRRFWSVGLIILATTILVLLVWVNTGNHQSEIVSETGQNSQSVETAIDCPNSITYIGDDPLPMADYSGTKKQIEVATVTQIHNQCPDTMITTAPKENIATQKKSDIAPESSNQSSSSTSTPPTTTSTPAATMKIDFGSIIAPYFDENDVSSINEAYSLNANNPYWGFVHSGIDFMSLKDIRVQASVDGTIENLETTKADGQMGWHTGFCINHGENSVCYNLETFSSDQSVGDRQKVGMQVKEGDSVKQGDWLGTLVHGGDGSHIDFGVITPGNRVCPEPYFTVGANESVLRLIHKDHPNWPICAD